MIEINLLPEKLKSEKDNTTFLKEWFFDIFVVVVALLVFFHFSCAIVILIKKRQYRVMNQQWMIKLPEIEKSRVWKEENKIATQASQDMTKLSQQRIIFSRKLKLMSEFLPEGIWFNRLQIKQKDFRLEGSVVSLEKEQMSLLRIFLEQLKKENMFFADFRRLELGPVKMRQLSGYQVMDFSLEGTLK